MFHSFIRLLLVEVEQFYILWDPVPHIFINNSKTPNTSSIKNTLRTKVVFHRRRWILMKQLPLAGHTSTDHFQKITLNYVEFVWPCS